MDEFFDAFSSISDQDGFDLAALKYFEELDRRISGKGPEPRPAPEKEKPKHDLDPEDELLLSNLDDGSLELWTLYKGKFSEPAQTGHTDSDSMTYQHPTIEATFVRREYDNALGAVAAMADEGVMETVETNWFTQVYEKVAS